MAKIILRMDTLIPLSSHTLKHLPSPRRSLVSRQCASADIHRGSFLRFLLLPALYKINRDGVTPSVFGW